jgi:hypothetical protein
MDQLYNNIETSKIDELICELCASMGSIHYDYSTLSSILAISNHQKEVNSSILNCIEQIDSGYLSETYTNNLINLSAGNYQLYIPSDQLAKGMYTLKLINGNEVYTKKVVKQ